MRERGIAGKTDFLSEPRVDCGAGSVRPAGKRLFPYWHGSLSPLLMCVPC